MKKLNKFFAVLVALAMMATLCVSMAFAEPAEKSVDIEKASLTKVFDVPTGVATPAAKFYFTFNPTSQPSSSTITAKTEVIPFDANTTGGKQTKILSLGSFIGFTDGKDIKITQPGEYVFNVSETQGEESGLAEAPAEGTTSYYVKDTNDKTTENVKFETKSYTLRLYVINDGGTLKFSAITVEDPAKEGETADAKKVKPDDQDPTVTNPTEKVGSEFKFTNTYTKTISDDEANGGAFNLEKDVTNAGDTAKKYPFEVTVTIDDATLNEGAYTLTATDGTKFEFTTTKLADTKTVNLAKGEKLVFTTFPAGAKVKIQETLDDTVVQKGSKYTATASGAIAGSVKNTALETAPINEKNNIKVTNDLANSEIEPEGILISNLPYIALALVAIGGLVAYVVVRRRQDDEA